MSETNDREQVDRQLAGSGGEQADPGRRSFLRGTALAGAAGAVGLAALLNLSPAAAKDRDDKDRDHDDDRDHDHRRDDFDRKKRDTEILIAAEIAEALAVTTYTNIINLAPFFGRIPDDDQDYLRAARQEEMSHYLLEQSVTGQPSPYTTFFIHRRCSKTRRRPSTCW
jgi:hypothetical protein